VTRIPELEQELVAAAARLQSPRRLLRPAVRTGLAAAAALVAGTVVLVDGSENGDERRRQPTPAGTQLIAPNLDHVDREAGVRFSLEGRVLTVRLLASAPDKTRNSFDGERIRATCGRSFSGADLRARHTRLWPAGSTFARFRLDRDISGVARWCRLEDPVAGHVAFVKFPNAPPGARVSPEQRIERIARRWARLFAAGDPTRCNYETQPFCERIECERPPNRRIENCTRPSAEFRSSFGDATVEDIKIRGRKAAVRFSNGETIELDEDASGREHPGVWWWVSGARGT
jgi:hypothetical protein